MGESLIAVVAEGRSGRVYLDPCKVPIVSEHAWKPEQFMNQESPNLVSGRGYGFYIWADLFTDRQLAALTTFSDLLIEVREQVIEDAMTAGLMDDGVRLRDGGKGAVAYADAVVTYLAFVVDKLADYSSTICSWNSPNEQMRCTFARQAIAMTWDYAEVNPFSSSSGSWNSMLKWVCKAISHLPASGSADVRQRDARARVRESSNVMISTDPPYYDNICYADISDFFYVWLRRNLSDIWPEECATLLTPKADEIIANTYRKTSKKEAEEHFEFGMAEFMKESSVKQISDIPATIYYAYKATETTKDGKVRSTGWDTFLQAVVSSGFQVTATWPLRTERSARPNAIGASALASSIVLACRTRPKSATLVSRSEFVAALRSELPQAIKLLQSGYIAPVDLPQSTIGPGIRVFSSYAKVVEANGSSMPVSDALTIINQVLDDVLYGEESELDAETRFALAWYAQYGFKPGPFGDADSVARAKNTAVEGVVRAGVGETSGGKFRLFHRGELDENWDPTSDPRLVAWEALQHLATRLERQESLAAGLLARLGDVGDRARQLAYLLHKIASDNEWAEEALVYNGLISAWPMLQAKRPEGEQQKLPGSS